MQLQAQGAQTQSKNSLLDSKVNVHNLVRPEASKISKSWMNDGEDARAREIHGKSSERATEWKLDELLAGIGASFQDDGDIIRK